MRISVLGIEFLSTSIDELSENVLKGGLIVVPSGPGLSSDLLQNEDYRKAVTSADISVTDSGAMVILWRLFKGERIIRISGLQLLNKLLSLETLKEGGQTFWIHPSIEQKAKNEAWINMQGFRLSPSDSYVAPLYPEWNLSDPVLFTKLHAQRPKVIFISIGGGSQERLGYWLREQYRESAIPCPAIVCTGAAIGFLSGNQVRIPRWADRLYLGWLFRCISEPRKFIPRYLNALPLCWLIFRYGDKLPPLKAAKPDL